MKKNKKSLIKGMPKKLFVFNLVITFFAGFFLVAYLFNLSNLSRGEGITITIFRSPNASSDVLLFLVIEFFLLMIIGWYLSGKYARDYLTKKKSI